MDYREFGLSERYKRIFGSEASKTATKSTFKNKLNFKEKRIIWRISAENAIHGKNDYLGRFSGTASAGKIIFLNSFLPGTFLSPYGFLEKISQNFPLSLKA